MAGTESRRFGHLNGATMPDPTFAILYVNDPAPSAAFYQRLPGPPPLEASPTFAMFALREGTMLGLWSKHTVAPAAESAGGGGEIGFTVESADAVDATHAQWHAQGL